jgi:3-oxoacyl-ACP reductase-like protein
MGTSSASGSATTSLGSAAVAAASAAAAGFGADDMEGGADGLALTKTIVSGKARLSCQTIACYHIILVCVEGGADGRVPMHGEDVGV